MMALEVKEAPGKGVGVYALRDFSEGDEVLVYDGRLVAFRDIPLPLRHEDDYFLQVGPDAYLTRPGGVGHHVNHACDPNCIVHITPTTVRLVALRPIAVGDEVTFDYATTSTEGPATWTLTCRCGSGGCRGIVSGFQTVPVEIQRRYIRAQAVPAYVLDSRVEVRLGYGAKLG